MYSAPKNTADWNIMVLHSQNKLVNFLMFQQEMSKNVRIRNQQPLQWFYTFVFNVLSAKSQREAIKTKILLCVRQTIFFFCQKDSLRLYQPSCWVQNSRLTDWDFEPKVPSWLVSKIGFDVNFLRQDTHNICTIRNSWRFELKNYIHQVLG